MVQSKMAIWQLLGYIYFIYYIYFQNMKTKKLRNYGLLIYSPFCLVILFCILLTDFGGGAGEVLPESIRKLFLFVMLTIGSSSENYSQEIYTCDLIIFTFLLS